jgi:hypothetical protein
LAFAAVLGAATRLSYKSVGEIERRWLMTSLFKCAQALIAPSNT